MQTMTTPLMKRIVDMTKKARSIIDMKNVMIEDLKREKEQIRARVPAEGQEEDLELILAGKRKKVEGPA